MPKDHVIPGRRIIDNFDFANPDRRSFLNLVVNGHLARAGGDDLLADGNRVAAVAVDCLDDLFVVIDLGFAVEVAAMDLALGQELVGGKDLVAVHLDVGNAIALAFLDVVNQLD